MYGVVVSAEEQERGDLWLTVGDVENLREAVKHLDPTEQALGMAMRVTYDPKEAAKFPTANRASQFINYLHRNSTDNCISFGFTPKKLPTDACDGMPSKVFIRVGGGS